MKTIIYHSADFDGIFCREIARKFLGDENVEYIGWNFGDAPLSVPKEGTIYVLDLPVDRVFGFNFADVKTIIGLPEFRDRLVWIDHHKTSIDTHPADIPGYRIDGVAACRLAWQWFSFEDGRPDGRILPAKQDFIDRAVREPSAVRLAGEYDIWDKRDPDAELFQHGLKSEELDDFWVALLSKDSWHVGGFNVVGRLLSRGESIAYVKAQDNASIIGSNGFTIQWEGLTCLACNASHYNSHLFTAGIRPEHDALLGFCLRKNGQWSVSLYGVPGKPDLDLSVIAKRHGGGGHKQACGFGCGDLPFPLKQ